MPLILAGLPPREAVLLTSFLASVLSGLVFYLAVRNFGGSEDALLLTIPFVFLVPRVRLYFTTLSGVVSLLALLVSLTFLFRDKGTGSHSWEFAASLGYFVHVRPENVLLAVPILCASLHSLGARRREAWPAYIFLLANLALSAAFSYFQGSPLWKPAPETLQSNFSQFFLPNVSSFLDARIFNPVLGLLLLVGWVGGKLERFSPLLLSLLAVSLVIYSSYTVDAPISNPEGHGLRFALVPGTVLLLQVSRLFSGDRELMLFLALSSAWLFFQSPFPHVESDFNSLVNLLREGSLVDGSGTVLFHEPVLFQSFRPGASVLDPRSTDITELGGSLRYLVPEYDEMVRVHGCNYSLQLEVPFDGRTVGVYSVDC